ncbi:hypothetical protein [Cellulomonas sp. URHD0024]|uniref:hypothetical protein n=1 Tax=Cellulomonas sp. URHD0024 TaxID=1302620 RepID=UPI00040FD045|nr:hypothetical protein [Cellulomonas sp. URHD0024]
MLVTVNRGSVAMGDDAVSHKYQVEVDPDLSVGAFLSQLIHPAGPPLASVHGEVSWLVQLRLAKADDPWHLGERMTLAVIHVPVGEPPFILPLTSSWAFKETLGAVADRSADGSVTVYFDYVSAGQRRSYAWFAKDFGG